MKIMRWCRSPLIRRHVLLLIGVLLVMGGVYTLTTLWLAQQAIESVQTRHQRDLAQIIARDHGFVRHGQLDMPAIRRAFQRYMVLNPSLELYLLDPSGRVELFSADPSRIKRTWVDPKPILAALAHPPPRWPLGDDPRSPTGKRPFSAAWLPSPQHPQKILYVVLSAGHVDQVNRYIQESVLLRMAFWGGLAALMVGLLLGGWIFYRLGRRIERTQQAAVQFTLDGEALPEPVTPVRDELDALHNALHDLMARLRQSWHTNHQLQQRKQTLIRGLVHDLRTPLTALQGYLELASEGDHKALQAAEKQLSRLRRLLAQLSLFVRLEGDTLPMAPEDVALKPWLDDLVTRYRTLHPEMEWQLQAECAPVCTIDLSLMERAVDNLLSNAASYSHARQVTVYLGCTAGQVQLRICDDGQGVTDAALERLFDSGFRADAARSGTHSGLGLSIVRMIIERHGGQVEAKHHSPTGLCIQLHWPCKQETPHAGG